MQLQAGSIFSTQSSLFKDLSVVLFCEELQERIKAKENARVIKRPDFIILILFGTN